MKKYVYSDDETKDVHWNFCEKNHAPFIELSNINKEYINFFLINMYNDILKINGETAHYMARIHKNGKMTYVIA